MNRHYLDSRTRLAQIALEDASEKLFNAYKTCCSDSKKDAYDVHMFRFRMDGFEREFAVSFDDEGCLMSVMAQYNQPLTEAEFSRFKRLYGFGAYVYKAGDLYDDIKLPYHVLQWAGSPLEIKARGGKV